MHVHACLCTYIINDCSGVSDSWFIPECQITCVNCECVCIIEEKERGKKSSIKEEKGETEGMCTIYNCLPIL